MRRSGMGLTLTPYMAQSLRRCKLDASGVRLMAQLLPQLEVQAELAQGCKALLLCIERHAAVR
jgi:hypothetical protein